MIQTILDSRDVLAVIPEESDRILCFQLPAIITPAITLVISTSLNVIKENQSLPSVYIHSSLSPWQRTEIFERAKKSAYKIIYTTPSQLLKNDFRDFIKHSEISTVIINYKWNDNFYNEFSRISQSISSLNFSSKKIPSIAVLIDIAGSQVQNDIKNLMRLKEPYIFISELDKKNIFFDVVRSDNKLLSISSIISEKTNDCGIIIADNPLNYDDILNELEQNSILLLDSSYSEKQILDDFNTSKNNILVTSRNSLNKITRQDIKFMIHYEIPNSLENFYQDISKINSIQKSESIILASTDELKNENIPEIPRIFCKSEKCLRYFMLNYFGQESENENCNNCSYCSGSNLKEEAHTFNFGKANDAQRQAISTTEEPLLIIAGPGTGKTFTLVQRTVYLIQE